MVPPHQVRLFAATGLLKCLHAGVSWEARTAIPLELHIILRGCAMLLPTRVREGVAPAKLSGLRPPTRGFPLPALPATWDTAGSGARRARIYRFTV